jgi:hypothetical protein
MIKFEKKSPHIEVGNLIMLTTLTRHIVPKNIPKEELPFDTDEYAKKHLLLEEECIFIPTSTRKKYKVLSLNNADQTIKCTDKVYIYTLPQTVAIKYCDQSGEE